MKRTGLLAAVLLCAMLLGALAGCGASSPEEQILGEWRSADGEISWIFYENGNMVGGEDGDMESANWAIDENTLSIQAMYETVVYGYEIDGDVLSLYASGEAAGEMYRFDGEMPAIKSSEEELRARLESSSLFSDELSSMRESGEVSYEFISTEDTEAGAVVFTYKIHCPTDYTYATEETLYEVEFLYSPLSDDFQLDGEREVGTRYYNLNLNGTWVRESDLRYVDLTISSVEFSNSISDHEDEYIVTYSYDIDDYEYGSWYNYSGTESAAVVFGSEHAATDPQHDDCAATISIFLADGAGWFGDIHENIEIDPVEGLRSYSKQ